MTTLVELDEIRAAHGRIASHVLRTPLVPIAGTRVLAKAESLQRTGAFKLRGALNTMLQLDESALSRGVVAHSSGNHAIAVACAADLLGCRATIVMPADAPRVKIDGTRAFGAEIVLVGPSSAERTERARLLADAGGLTLIEPYDAREIVAATGTIGLEIVADDTDVDEVYVPISGGGLAAGVARAIALTAPHVRVIGVEPAVAADALASWRAGHRVSLPPEQMARTSADGLRVQRVGDVPWQHLQAHLHDIVTVSEDEIMSGVSLIARSARLVAEPSGAVAVVAALRSRSRRPVGVLSGGNVDPGTLREALSREVPLSGGDVTRS